jgi:hypothetical protein
MTHFVPTHELRARYHGTVPDYIPVQLMGGGELYTAREWAERGADSYPRRYLSADGRVMIADIGEDPDYELGEYHVHEPAPVVAWEDA